MNYYLLRIATVFVLSATLLACGFHLRDSSQFAYKNMYISGNTQINKPLTKSLQANGLQIVNNPADAEMQLELLKEESEKRILSLSGTGVVREFELFYRVHFRTKSTADSVWSPPQTMEARRDFSYEDANLLAKQAEEKRLNENMRSDVVSGLVRRLAAIKK